MKESSIFNARRSTSSQILYCVLGGSIRTRHLIKHGNKASQSYRDFDGINGEPTEFEWNIFPGFDTLQLCGKVKDLLSRLGETPENFTGRILVMSMFNDISCGTKDNEEECLAHAKVVSLYARKFGTGQWSLIGPGSGKKWYSMKADILSSDGTISRRRCWWNSPKADIRFSVPRLHCPEVNSGAKDMENCRFTLLPLRKQVRLCFA